MNYTVAIVEDDPSEAGTLQMYFKRYTSEHDDTFQMEYFQDGSQFLTGYQPIYDLVLMDINLPGFNGMETAARLRKLDQSVALIFVTSLSRYAAKGYEVDAMDFLVKPVGYPNFSVKIQRALRRRQSRCNTDLLISIPNGVYRMSASHIKYIEISNHSLIYHTTEGNLTSYGSLKAVEAMLNSRQFVRCNSCYLVNLAFVRGISGSTLLVAGEELQISRPKRNMVLETLNAYLGGGI